MNCQLCGHSLENNTHGFDQNDASMDGDKLVHSGHCTYCKICNPTIFAKQPPEVPQREHEWTGGEATDCCSCGWHCVGGSSFPECKEQWQAHIASLAQREVHEAAKSAWSAVEHNFYAPTAPAGTSQGLEAQCRKWAEELVVGYGSPYLNREALAMSVAAFVRTRDAELQAERDKWKDRAERAIDHFTARERELREKLEGLLTPIEEGFELDHRIMDGPKFVAELRALLAQ